MYNILSRNTGMKYEDVVQACDRDNYLSPEDAVQLGFIDGIIMCEPKAFMIPEEDKLIEEE